MAEIKATIFLETQFWVGTFERTDREGYAVARHIFGKEPSDNEVHEFVLNHYESLNFGEKQDVQLTIKRMNPKRASKLARREMEVVKKTNRPSTIAQDYMRLEQEKNKTEKKRACKAQKELREKIQFNLKQQKKKKKQKGR